MSVYYFKGAKILAPLTITSNEPVYDIDTVSLSKQRASQGVQRWELSFTTTVSGDGEIDAFLGMISNITTPETMIMPQLPTVDKVNTISPSRIIAANAAAGASSVTINSDGFLSKGSFIKFSNHDKIYAVLADVSTGTAAVQIYPTLRVPVSTSDTIKTGSSVILKYYRDINNLRGITFKDGVLASPGTITLIEAIT